MPAGLVACVAGGMLGVEVAAGGALGVEVAAGSALGVEVAADGALGVEVAAGGALGVEVAAGGVGSVRRTGESRTSAVRMCWEESNGWECCACAESTVVLGGAGTEKMVVLLLVLSAIRPGVVACSSAVLSSESPEDIRQGRTIVGV